MAEGPYVLALVGDPQVNLGGVVRWLARVDEERVLHWTVDFLETMGPADEAIEASIHDTPSLAGCSRIR